MNKIIKIYIVCCFLVWNCGNNTNPTLNQVTVNNMDEQDKSNLPKILFENPTHDLGDIIEGTQVTDTFHFRNIGKSILIISDIETSCGCTSSTSSKEPVKPEEEGEIIVSFDSTHKNGETTVSVVVIANTYPVNTILTLKANVKERKLN